MLGLKARLGAMLGHVEAVMGSGWDWGGRLLGPTETVLGSCWGSLKPSWGHVGALGGHVGACWSRPGVMLRLVGAVLGSYYGSLKPSWAKRASHCGKPKKTWGFEHLLKAAMLEVYPVRPPQGSFGHPKSWRFAWAKCIFSENGTFLQIS